MKINFLTLFLSISLFGGWIDDKYIEIFNIDLNYCQKTGNPFDKAWKPFISHSDNAISKFQSLDNEKTESSWLPFISTKESIRQDFNDILNDMILTFTEDTLIMKCLENMKILNRRIIREKDSILKIKENNISELSESNKKEIQLKLRNILRYKNQIIEIKKFILKELQKLGLDLKSKDLEALLIRVDSENIIQLMVVFDISKNITLKLEELMRLNSDNLKISKRYYGMNLILSEIALYIQNRYIISINSKYVPRLKSVILKINNLRKDTQILLNNSSTKYEKNIYLNNIKSQELTIKTANIYIKNLEKQKEQIEIAKEKSINNLNLTRNSYRTMQIGFNLLNLVKSTQLSFSKIISIQLPEIIPFQNKNIEREYKKLTEELQK